MIVEFGQMEMLWRNVGAGVYFNDGIICWTLVNLILSERVFYVWH